jgi:Tfp pilus assembly protein PilN
VFADVPTAAELASAQSEAAAARNEIAAAKRGRSAMLLFVVLLLGALVATGAFAFIDRGATQGKMTALTEANEQAKKDVERLETANKALTAELGPYQAIANQERQVAQLQQKIRAKTDQPVYAGLKLTPVERALLDGTTPWTVTALNANSWKGRVDESLSRQIAQLTELQTKVDAFTPPTAAAGGAGATPGCVDIRRC